MTYTFLGDEFADDARDLSDTAFRLHVEGLVWSVKRMSDCAIDERDLPRLTDITGPKLWAVIGELIEAGFWERDQKVLRIIHGSHWQLTKRQVLKKKRDQRERTNRSRRHHEGDHSLCLPKTCAEVRKDNGSLTAGYHSTPNHTTPGVRSDTTRDVTRDTSDPWDQQGASA